MGSGVFWGQRLNRVEGRDPSAEGLTDKGELVDVEGAQKFTQEIHIGLDRVVDERLV
jgi:hypothetical protein